MCSLPNGICMSPYVAITAKRVLRNCMPALYRSCTHSHSLIELCRSEKFSLQFCSFHYCGKSLANITEADQKQVTLGLVQIHFVKFWRQNAATGQSLFPFLADYCIVSSVESKRLITCQCCLSQLRITMKFGLFLSSLGESSFFQERSSSSIFLPYATTFTPISSIRCMADFFLCLLIRLRFSYMSFERVATTVFSV